MSKIQKFLARHTRAIIISLIVIILILGSLVGYLIYGYFRSEEESKETLNLITALSPSNLAKSVSQNQSSKSTEKLPEDNTQAINIKLKNEKLFTKRVNNDETVKLERQQAKLCGARNSLSYSITEKIEGRDFVTSMTIGNKKDYIKDVDLKDGYDQILKYLGDIKNNETEYLFYAFNMQCTSPYYPSFYAQNIEGLSYPNIDQSRVVLTWDGAVLEGRLGLQIYAKKGDNIILITKSIEGDLTISNSEFKKQCAEVIDCDKLRDDLINDYKKKQLAPAKIAEIKVEAQKLIELFAIEN